MNRVAFYGGCLLIVVGLAVWLFRPAHGTAPQRNSIRAFGFEFTLDTPAFVVMALGIVLMALSISMPEPLSPAPGAVRTLVCGGYGTHDNAATVEADCVLDPRHGYHFDTRYRPAVNGGRWVSVDGAMQAIGTVRPPDGPCAGHVTFTPTLTEKHLLAHYRADQNEGKNCGGGMEFTATELKGFPE